MEYTELLYQIKFKLEELYNLINNKKVINENNNTKVNINGNVYNLLDCGTFYTDYEGAEEKEFYGYLNGVNHDQWTGKILFQDEYGINWDKFVKEKK